MPRLSCTRLLPSTAALAIVAILAACAPRPALPLGNQAGGALPASGAAPAVNAPAPTTAFPGAQGWAASTPGGRGGALLRVTTLAASGPGSLAAAVATAGPRIVVFEVGGVIDLGRTVIDVRAPYLTIAGQTAP